MNEAETRAELIDPLLLSCGWGRTGESKISREYQITHGKIQTGGTRSRPLIADYLLSYKNVKLAVIEAKSTQRPAGEGVAQAKLYAEKLKLDFAYATNGREIYHINMKTGREGPVDSFPSPAQLWAMAHEQQNRWRDAFHNIPFEDKSGSQPPRFYQEIAVNRALEAVAEDKNRILLTLATGTGKTFIAFQIAWKLFYTRWNLKKDGSRRPRILFLADRNILADQAFNAFNSFPEDALVRIAPDAVRKKGRVPTNGNIFFTIFQTFMSGRDENGAPAPNFGEYPRDYFDFIIIDECHRGGANDESNWRGIMEYFSPAVQLGLTATPKRKNNVDTYAYFGEPVYIYSLKEGINDGFLTPFKVKRVQTTIDEYIYTSDDTVVEGEVEEGRVYGEEDFNRIIQIKEREEKRVQIILDEIHRKEKTLVFCANQEHALA
ncbi:MAG: DEAD/DEAH box helicase family protein, partial [Spirochaetaceae bacterium]|nr:DEAD/DEAH box helicase family protein [Spirochaetaceae bacterium]